MSTPPLALDEQDEYIGKLLRVIEQARAEVNAGRCVEAGLTLTTALAEHRVRLTTRARVSPIVSYWWAREE